MNNKIRHYRFLNDEMTQAELAKKVNVVRQTIIAIEKGAFNPSVKLALKMSSVLGVKLEELFSLEVDD